MTFFLLFKPIYLTINLLRNNGLNTIVLCMLKNIFFKLKKSSICSDFCRIFELLLTNN